MNSYFDLMLSEINDSDISSSNMPYILVACDFACWSNLITSDERSQLLDIALKKYNSFKNSSQR